MQHLYEDANKFTAVNFYSSLWTFMIYKYFIEFLQNNNYNYIRDYALKRGKQNTSLHQFSEWKLEAMT